MNGKKIIYAFIMISIVSSVCIGCGTSKTTDVGSVYFLNFKPEQAEQWKEIASIYTKETGVPVKVRTAASNQYEQTLKVEMAKKDSPTIFQINGPMGYQNWSAYCEDLSKTELYAWLKDSDMAIKEGSSVYGIPYVVEGYGIIYNQAIMERYFAMDGAKATSMDEIYNFKKLKTVVEDMTQKKKSLGLDGVFASTSFAPGADWRWQTHLLNLPIYYELKDKKVSDLQEISFSHEKNYKNIFDLYLQNSTMKATMVGAKTVDDSMSEFALGKCAMVQNGNWAWSQISSIEGNVVTADDIKFLPIYTDVAGEEKQGLCVGTENYISINNQRSELDQKASIKFLQWVFGSDEGKKLVSEKLEFISPFQTFSKEENPADPLSQEIVRYMDNPKLTSVNWSFTIFPSQTFKDHVGALLFQYAIGKMKWSDVSSQIVREWKIEKEEI